MARVRIGIPVRDRHRASAFYSALFGIERPGSIPLEFVERGAVTLEPLRLTIKSVEDALAIVWTHGGRIVDPDCRIDGRASCALVVDTEGNCLALLPSGDSAQSKGRTAQKISFTPIDGNNGSVSSSSSS